MKMTKLTTLFLTATLTPQAVAYWQPIQAPPAATATRMPLPKRAVAPDAKQNIAPNNVDNSNINTGNTNTGGTNTGTMNHDGMSTDKVHKNSMCKDGNARPE